MITYYYVKANPYCSFYLTAKRYISSLRKAGYKVEEANISQIKPNPYALVYPLFFLRNDKGIQSLKDAHKYLIGFHSSGTDRFGQRWVKLFNNPEIDLLIAPSEYTKNALVNSGVKTRIEIVPHGISEEFRPLNLTRSLKLRVLTFIWHNPFEKGADVLIKLAKKFPDISFTVSGNGLTGDIPPNIRIDKTWRNESQLANFYNTFDIYLGLQRDGAFELCPLEALACGLIVISNKVGGVPYLNENNSLLIPPKGKVKLFENGVNQDEVGYVADPDVEGWYKAFDYCIHHIKELKEKAIQGSKEIRSSYSLDKIGQKLKKVIGEL